MKTCPFCGSSPEIKEYVKQYSVRGSSGARNSVKVAQKGKFNGRLVNVYQQTQYIVRCSNKNCLLYSLTKKFWSPEEGYAAWNATKEETNED